MATMPMYYGGWQCYSQGVGQTATAEMCTIGSSQGAYGSWPFNVGSTSEATNVTIWYHWNQQGYWNEQGYWAQPYGSQPPITREDAEREMLRVQEAQAEAIRAQEERRRQHEEAEKKATELLFMFLTPEQRAQYEKDGYFETEVNDQRYRIRKGRAGNIDKLDKSGRAISRMCVHPMEILPDSDNVLAQLLALHTNQMELERTANHTRLV